MKKSSLAIGIFSLFTLTQSFAVLPPAYLSVSHWESCTVTLSKGTYQFLCLPPSKPSACPSSSWRTLNKGQMLPLCPLCDLNKKPKKNS